LSVTRLWLSAWVINEPNGSVVFLVLVSRRRNVADELEAVSASALHQLPSFSTLHLRRPARAVVAVCNQVAIVRRRRPPFEFIGLKGLDLIRSGVSGPVRDRIECSKPRWLEHSWKIPSVASAPETPSRVCFLHCHPAVLWKSFRVLCLFSRQSAIRAPFSHLLGTALSRWARPCHFKSPRYLESMLVVPRNTQHRVSRFTSPFSQRDSFHQEVCLDADVLPFP